MSDAGRLFVYGFIAALGWAVGFLARVIFIRVAVALIVLVLGVIVMLYALWIGAMLWFITGRLGIARGVAKRDILEQAIAGLLPVSLAVVSLAGGRSLANAFVILILASCGALLWQRRREALRLGHARLPKLPAADESIPAATPTRS